MVEVRFASELDGPLNFVTGFYYQKDENSFEVQSPLVDGTGRAVPWDAANTNDAFIFGGTAIFGRLRDDEIEQKALFGELTYDIADRLQLLVGLRAFEVELSSIQQTTHGFFNGALTPSGTIIGTNANGFDIGLIELNDNTVRPKVSLSFDVNDDVMLYALYSEGFRVGGVNNAHQPFAPGVPATFDSDELQNLEFGIKSRFAGNALQLNASVFIIDWDDIQVEPRDPLAFTPFVTNGGAAQVNGFEWAIQWLAGDNLQLDFTGTYLFDHELTTDQPVLPGVSPLVISGLDGDEIPNTPDLQLYVSAKYDAQLMGKPLSLIADLTYRGSTDTEFRTNSPFNIPLDSYAIVNLFATMEISEHLSVGAYVKNVGDELAVYDGIGTVDNPQAIVAARPRTIGATLKWTY